LANWVSFHNERPQNETEAARLKDGTAVRMGGLGAKPKSGYYLTEHFPA
jgi:hypothetical protein